MPPPTTTASCAPAAEQQPSPCKAFPAASTLEIAASVRPYSAEQHAGMATDQLPVFDLAPFLERGDEAIAEELATALVETGCLVVRDPRVRQQDNEAFLDVMETYFQRPAEAKMRDTRPELSYQVGATPEGTERPRLLSDAAMRAEAGRLPDGHRPTLPDAADAKWRFFWRVGERPAATAYPELNAQPVVPEGIPRWAERLDGWGAKMLAATEAVAQLAAVGLGLPRDAFSSRMAGGPHLLAPTGVDLSGGHAVEGRVYAGYHYDLNLLTIHGKSRFPGLYVWLRDGRRVAVRVPDGCLLLQAGKQLEWLTGGRVRAGMHEVVCTRDTLAAVEAARAQGRPLWRVSSTVFAHVASDAVLEPLGRFAGEPGARGGLYPPTPAGEYVQQELRAIKLAAQ